MLHDGLPAADDVMLTVGATGALNLVFLALAGPGDEVLLADPFFVMYRNLALPTALACDIQPWVERHREKRALAADTLEAAGYRFNRPGGTIFMFVEAQGGADLAFCQRALERKVVLVPGRAFSHRSTHFRVCIGVDEETLRRGLEGVCELR